MKAFIAGALGALVVGGGLMAWNGRSTEPAMVTMAGHPPAQLVSTNGPTAPTTTFAEAPMPGATGAVAVRCEPGQQAVVRHVPGVAGATSEVACVGEPDVAMVGMPAMAGARVMPASYAPRAVPTVERVVYRDRPVVRRSAARRSWKKTALVIGGSAGAGAGVGALAGGKKGALIGAAIGGGAASIYEAIKR